MISNVYIINELFLLKVGVALKPGTPADIVVDYIDLADMILVMTVEPGFGGQKFMESMMPKVAWLRQNYPTLDIEVDGGVGPATIEACAKVSLIYKMLIFAYDKILNIYMFLGWCKYDSIWNSSNWCYGPSKSYKKFERCCKLRIE